MGVKRNRRGVKSRELGGADRAVEMVPSARYPTPLAPDLTIPFRERCFFDTVTPQEMYLTSEVTKDAEEKKKKKMKRETGGDLPN